MEEKWVNVGIFWVLPDNDMGDYIAELRKRYHVSEAGASGFINYPYSHYEMWHEIGTSEQDCYKYPRGRVLYDTKTGKHRIFADECISIGTIEELVKMYEIEEYEIWRDEHYVCSFCRKRKRKKELKYSILRGKDKIGENLIEISYGKTKILAELGKSLDTGGKELEKEILNKHYSAVIVSHYHEDHAGLINDKKDCPIYIGNGAYNIIKATNEYDGKELSENIGPYYNGRAFMVGEIKVTPYLCDHSAYDSYMLLFEAGEKSILYTGDFRFHGRKDKNKLLYALPKSPDVLIHEGTNIGRNAYTMTEAELENKALEIMKSTQGPVFVLQSSTNIDRLVSIYRASKKDGRIMYMDNYVSLIAKTAGGHIPRPDVFGDVIAFTPRAIGGKQKEMFFEIKNKRGINGIAKGTKHFTMLVRPTMFGYIKKLFSLDVFKDSVLIYSMWKGYKQSEHMSAFLDKISSLGIKIVDLHTSGHASPDDIELLKQTLNPKETICVHTSR